MAQISLEEKFKNVSNKCYLYNTKKIRDGSYEPSLKKGGR